MILIEIVVLAVVQGITEFLPISSSGHVVVVAALFDQFGHPLAEKLTVNVMLHLGTLVAVVLFYWRRIGQLFGRDRRVIWLLGAGTLPAAIAGPLAKWLLDDALQSALLAGFAFPVTGIMLLATIRAKPGGLTCRELTWRRALLIGGFQALAILPGISRSGTTIVAGLGCGLKREEAAAFSFLLAIPVIGGAGLLELLDLVGTPSNSTPPGLLALGAGLSFAVGLASLAWLVQWLRRGRLHYFAWWVLPLGPIVIVWQLLWA